MLFSTAYLPPVSYFISLLKSPKIVFEKHEHYVKQTFRNRALICTANGIHPLIIPVVHDELYTQPIHKVKISYETDWQKIHWRTIASSYRRSPYFEFFEDELRPLYENRVVFLFEFNLGLLEKILSLFQVSPSIEFTEKYQEDYGGETKDLRMAFLPHNRQLDLPQYTQVFKDRFDFLPDLSILDYICNNGFSRFLIS